MSFYDLNPEYLERFCDPLALHKWINVMARDFNALKKADNLRQIAFGIASDSEFFCMSKEQASIVIAWQIRDQLWQFTPGYVRAAYELMWLLHRAGDIEFETAGLYFMNDGMLEYPHEGDLSWDWYWMNKKIVQIRHAAPYERIFLKSRYWQLTREAELLRAGNQCEMCGVDDGLQVHHLTYERRGNEQPGDLQVLCWRCHRSVHGRAV